MTRSRTALCALFVTLLCASWPARAAEAADLVLLRVREAVLDPSGSARVVVGLSGVDRTLVAGDFTIREGGRSVAGVSVTPLAEAQADAVSAVLAVDVSGSTAGKPLADAKAAAKAFLAGLHPRIRVALVAFGADATLKSAFTADRARLVRLIDGLAAKGDTALYDAVVLSAAQFGKSEAASSIIVFSDGKDTGSSATLGRALDAAKRAGAPVTAIALQTGDIDLDSLRALSQATGGRLLSVRQSGDLQTAFASAARDIASQYVLSYTMAGRRRGDVEISVAARVGGASASDSIVALAPEPAVPPAANAPTTYEPAPGPLVGVFGSDLGWQIGIGAAFAGIALLLMVLIWRPRRSEEANVLARGLRLYTRGQHKKKQSSERQGALARRASEMLERVPKPPRYEERLQTKIDRAGWPFRAAEFIGIQIGGALAGGVIGFVLLGRWWMGVALAGFGCLIPGILLARKIASRQSAFLDQLPDTLQLLAGSLQAGYGFLQAIDTLVKESPAPTSVEFGRVLTETRLGMTVDDALNSMADRLQSEDFRWVVLAVNIQRQVGGNLAVLLHTVADTLRERERVRRQIKVLSAEGKLSAWILGALPFGIAGYIMMVNPEFLKVMTSEPIGKMMIGGSLGLLGVGILWMRKIIRIEV